MTPKVGDVFQQFRILEKIGEGGMGEVFLARDTRLERDVALKFLTRVARLSVADADLLRREARSLAALNHPNIVTIHDIGDADGVPFLVLEWIPGTPLNDPSHRLPLDEGAFLQVAVPVADALSVAHARGIVHRDVKPGNVLMTAEGRVKLVDFGLAILRERDVDATRSGTIMGTMAYMSPEQATGAEVGAASDIFSFGVMAHELLSGQRPFQAGSVPLSSVRPGISSSLVGLVDRCLKKDAAERFQDGAELAQQLHQVRNRQAPALQPGTGQDIRFCTTADGVGIAYAVIGNGPLLVRVLGHFTHLEMEWEWPALRLLWEKLAKTHTIIRYDGRGIGLSDHWSEAFTEETRQLDLEAVLNAVQAERVGLLGISEGGWTAAVYANAHPERVTHLILYGAYSRGARARPGYDKDEDAAMITLMRKGWGRDTPVFRQLFTSQFFRSHADPALMAHFNQMQRASADPETAARYQESAHNRGDGSEIFERLRLPTLVIHCRDDQAVSFEEGRRLAAIVPGAQFVPLPSGTHYFPTDEETTAKVVEAIDRFTC